ncbi:hypothetical protein [Geobacter sp. DSM 9736]|uniref:hypothetical protein n=1 Tax=Geobacter sp. DSM 9736 TaxID=1277350 RepID=UPI000B4FE250|nr:hypothetical protein [Geobacter sp. DSM 9736]
MGTKSFLTKTKELVAPLETENVIRFATSLTLKSIMENPLILTMLMVVFFYAVVKRSKFVLAFLFACVSTILLVRFTLQGHEGDQLSLGSTLPFAFGSLIIGGALIYFLFVKSE